MPAQQFSLDCEPDTREHTAIILTSKFTADAGLRRGLSLFDRSTAVGSSTLPYPGAHYILLPPKLCTSRWSKKSLSPPKFPCWAEASIALVLSIGRQAPGILPLCLSDRTKSPPYSFPVQLYSVLHSSLLQFYHTAYATHEEFFSTARHQASTALSSAYYELFDSSVSPSIVMAV